MIKDILFALGLGFKVVSTFGLSVYIGVMLDRYFNMDGKCIFVMIFVAFFMVMKMLLGVMKRE